MISEEQKKRYKELLNERKRIRKKSIKQTKRNYLISLGTGAVIGLFLAVAMIKADQEGKMDIDKSVWLFMGGFLFFIAAYILHIILHEAGHLIFGLLTGYKFLSYRIFSTIFYKKDGKIHRKKFAIKGTAGQCLMYPPKPREDGSFPFVLYNLGGGINNLIFSLPFVIPFILTQGIYGRIIYFVLMMSGILTAATNVIPMNVGLQNDGMNVKSMLKDKNMRKAFYLQLKVNAELSDGKQITDYPIQAFELPENADVTNMLTAFVRIMSYYQQLAFYDFDTAEKILASMEEKSSDYQPAVLNVVEAEWLFFMVLRHRPAEEIASIYEHVRFFLSIAKTDISIQRVRYVYEAFLTEDEKRDIMTLINKKPPKKWMDCDREKAYRDFLNTAENFPVSGEADMNVKVVEYIRSNSAQNGLTAGIF